LNSALLAELGMPCADGSQRVCETGRREKKRTFREGKWLAERERFDYRHRQKFYTSRLLTCKKL